VDIVRRLWYISILWLVRMDLAKSIDRARYGRSYEDDSTYRYRHVDHLGQLDQSDAVQCYYKIRYANYDLFCDASVELFSCN